MMKNSTKNKILLLLQYLVCISNTELVCCSNLCNEYNNDENTCPIGTGYEKRYIMYDVNPHEGFNLRRDVYIRLAVLINKLNNITPKYHLVLPPWDNLPHWRSIYAAVGKQSNLPWSLFFDMNSLNSFIPVMDTFEFNEGYENDYIDHIIVLQNYQDIGKPDFKWSEKWNVEDCHSSTGYFRDEYGFHRHLMNAKLLPAESLTCISFQGSASLLSDIINVFDSRSIRFERAEVVLHDFYGSHKYWECRNSMKFSKDLVDIAVKFKNSLDSQQSTSEITSTSKYYAGGPYLCAHLRRRDYLKGRPMQTPSIPNAVNQVKRKLEQFNLSTVFLATDATESEIEEFSQLMQPMKTVQFEPSMEISKTFKDGGIAIIEQIICSYARFFIGSHESTFSFRIQEERELLNFDSDTTFNRLCGDNEGTNCKQPTKWLKPSLEP